VAGQALTFSKDLRRLPIREVLISTAMPPAMQIPHEERSAADARSAALSYVSEAFALALLDGIDADDFAEAALCAAMCELVAAHGEDSAALVAARLADRAAAGEFSVSRRQ
jgi:hypothetical protein